MAKSKYAHLFDYDHPVVNKSEVILDRLLELLEIPEDRIDEIRERLENFASMRMILVLIERLPMEKQKFFVEKIKEKDVNLDFIKDLKSNFNDQELVYSYNSSMQDVLKDKLQLLKSKLNAEQAEEFERLIESVGK